jgi:hypothetical protein
VLQSMLGVWVCDCALDEASVDMHILVDIALDGLRTIDDLHAVDTKLLFLCLQAFEREGRASPAIRGLGESIARSLTELPSIPTRHAGIAAVLYELGYAGIRAGAIPVAAEPGIDALLCGSPEKLRRVCGAVAAESHFGARRVRPERFVGLRRVLPILLLQTLRSYDLDTGAMLLRTARYLRLRTGGRLDESISFVIDQQDWDGRFGFFAVERSAFRESAELRHFDDVLSLHLPITSACAWALAEVMRGGGVVFARSGRGARVAAPRRLSNVH